MQKRAGKGGPDRISALPTSALHRILSFLTTKQAAQTSVLSRRWRRLWTTAPTLSFDVAEFLRLGESWERKLLKAVDEVLAHHSNPDLERLDLQLISLPDLFSGGGTTGENTSTILSKLLSSAAARNPREVALGFTLFPRFFELPRRLSTCESLRVLELRTNFSDLSIPTPAHLPNLRTLRLRSVVFEDDSLQRLISSSPALEDLDMQHVLFHSLHVSTPALTRLAAPDFGFHNCKLLVSAPNLRSLHYRPMSSDMGCVLLNLDSVVDAFIDINRPDTECVGTPTGELLKALHKVRALTLHFWGAPDQYLSPEKELWNRFVSKPQASGPVHLAQFTEAIIYILQHVPNLETLVIESDGPERCKLERRFGLSERQWGNWIPRRKDLNIALRQLKTIEIKNFESSANELELVSYLLKVTAGFLKKMVIIPYQEGS